MLVLEWGADSQEPAPEEVLDDDHVIELLSHERERVAVSFRIYTAGSIHCSLIGPAFKGKGPH